MSKTADTDHPIENVIARRWSPSVWADRSVSPEILRSLFEAARWSASSFNEQPWRYIVVRKEDGEAFEKLVDSLMEGNQQWARHAPVLALGLSKKTFTKNGKPNRVALHDLGAASATLTLEATARGLYVHQMAGVEREKAREIWNVPEEFEVQTGLAIGYRGEPDDAPDPKIAERDQKTRTRKPLEEFVFGGEFGAKAKWL